MHADDFPDNFLVLHLCMTVMKLLTLTIKLDTLLIIVSSLIGWFFSMTRQIHINIMGGLIYVFFMLKVAVLWHMKRGSPITITER
jgi:hypothetical protein